MSVVRRIYVEKKPEFAAAAKSLKSDIESYLEIGGVKNVRVLIRYDIQNMSDETYEKAKDTIFSEPPVDNLYENSFSYDGRVFSAEYLPGQFDQRSDSATQCVGFISSDDVIIKNATTYVIEGKITDDEFDKIKTYCINPVDSRVASEEVPDTLVDVYDEPEAVEILYGFITASKSELKSIYKGMNLAMTFDDFKCIQDYFESELRDPTITEIRVLDTYWSDHCRHTTFSTELSKIMFEESHYTPVIKATYDDYLKNFKEFYKDRDDKYICLMDIALMGMRRLKADGLLDDQEESDEINACSIVVPIEIDGKTEEWLINFKNETHNHPTEIEPFGGAATCLGGAIRDPLSGRTYVYQAMRVTGAADPTKPLSETLPGKLPQKQIVTEAAGGYSSYGNQIGLATGYVKEIYHPLYVAKRMEIGAVIAAAPRKDIKRLSSDPGDKIVLLGGRTGRDGIGGATGSSKAHNEQSTLTCGAEVQKGNPPTERKIQRLFRRPEVTSIIKKCNDFGAGGVSVAIGELADGLEVDLDLVPKKYAGLDGTELAISESQERMACVIAPENVDEFLKYSAEENLEATVVATVTEKPNLILKWRGENIVDIKRAFLDTNGAHLRTKVMAKMPMEKDNYLEKYAIPYMVRYMNNRHFIEATKRTLRDLDVASQKGLVERFDSSIGAGTVLMPYGGKTQLTPIQTMVAKVPVGNHKSDAATMMSYGFDPHISRWSPYHGAHHSVVSSVSKIVATGGDYSKIRFSFQEYFKRMTNRASRWSEPFLALLGAYDAQIKLGLPAIGGKDSMSGTFNDINVPPTLVSFAIDMCDAKEVISPEFTKSDSKIMLFELIRDEYDLPDYDLIHNVFKLFYELIKEKRILSAYSIEATGIISALSLMSFGNKIGFKIAENYEYTELFKNKIGSIVAEISESDAVHIAMKAEELGIGKCIKVIGETTPESAITIGSESLSIDDAIDIWMEPLAKVFPNHSTEEKSTVDVPTYSEKKIYVCKHKVAKPKVFIPVFPGTNCEYDSAKAFEQAGADAEILIFKNQTESDIRDSVDAFKKAINTSQIIMFPGGFSGGDEPEGSAKFFATAFRNEAIKEAVSDLLGNRDGLALGICNGFQALVKLGLVPHGDIVSQVDGAPTLTYNTIHRHISKMVQTKIMSNKSPWLANTNVGDVYITPASHGEGRFVASDEWIKKLFDKGMVATCYVDNDGNPTMDEEFNVNGSYSAIEGITSEDGRVFGRMAHAERIGDQVAINIYGDQNMNVFKSGVEYFTK